MRPKRLSILVLAVGLASLMAATAMTEMFEPLVLLKSFEGVCMVKLPGTETYVTATQGKAYPYGTTFMTGSGSSAVLGLANDSTVDLAANTRILMAEDKDNPSSKSIGFLAGTMTLNLADGFNDFNTVKIITRCISATVPLGGTYALTTTTEADLRVVELSVTQGELGVAGPYFDIPAMVDNDELSVACSADRSFVRLRNIRGTYAATVRDSEGNPRLIELAPGAVVKLLQKPSDAARGRTIVTVLEIDPSGNITGANTFSSTDGPDEGADSGGGGGDPLNMLLVDNGGDDRDQQPGGNDGPQPGGDDGDVIPPPPSSGDGPGGNGGTDGSPEDPDSEAPPTDLNPLPPGVGGGEAPADTTPKGKV